MGEHLVAGCETRYVLAKSGDDTSRFDAECQRWLSAHVPVAHADDLVPVADPCGAHRDHELVRRGRSRRRELEHVNLAAERVDAGGLHPSHRHLQGSYAGAAPTAGSVSAAPVTVMSAPTRPHRHLAACG